MNLVAIGTTLVTMKRWFICLALLLPALAWAELYKWTDEKGNVHFSDKPLDDKAETYEPPPVLVVPAGPEADFSQQNAEEEANKPVKYKSLSIVSPTNDQTFFSDTAQVNISVSLDPGLDQKSGHQVIIYLDGNTVSKGTGLSHSAGGLNRGSHTASAAVLDQKGKTLIKSNSVTFHIKRHHL